MQRGSGTGGFIDHIGTIHHLRCLSIRIMLYNYFSSDRSLAPWPLYSIGLMVSWSSGLLVRVYWHLQPWVLSSSGASIEQGYHGAGQRAAERRMFYSLSIEFPTVLEYFFLTSIHL